MMFDSGFPVEDFVVDGKLDQTALIRRVKGSLRSPDPFTNAMLGAIYEVTSQPGFLEARRTALAEKLTPSERVGVEMQKVLENECDGSESVRKKLAEKIVEGYHHAAHR
ncbi:hypothetical protein [Marinobacter sp. F3R08]|uniref:hypothetical protein n=1 Tax=Marinobacter sp. F3R08 TaxID=2841559 RepID=UPI001C08708F|nr:hypothetical protein [Marinobacter sp. F3R08]MBU2952189.1 hypothetical protein [Marinobacter sp. F3R08]